MKRGINFFTIIAVIFSFFLLNSRFNLWIAGPVTALESVEKRTFVDYFLEKLLKRVEKMIVKPFANFPLDKQKFIDIEVDEDTFNNFTEREQKDQVLDWLLYTTVYSSDKTVEVLSEILYDLPPIRYGYMQPAANFEFGDTRSCVTGDSSIIALIPRDIPDDRYKDYLATIADKHRKNLGEKPKIIHLFRYKIDLKGRYALLTRCRDVNAGDLFTGEYGYYTSTVKNLDDFKGFMGTIEDITYAEVVVGGLKLGGRKLKEPYRGIRVEDVAAIWQAVKEIRDRLKKFNAKWQHNFKILIAKMNEYNQQIEKIKYLEESSGEDKNLSKKIEKSPQVKMESVSKGVGGYQPPEEIISDQHYGQEFNKLRKMKQEDFIKEQIPAGVGFSLDLTYDFKGLQEAFSDPERLYEEISSSDSKLIEKKEIQKAVDALHDNDIVPLLVILDNLKKCDNDRAQFFAVLFEALVQRCHLHAARYVGLLKGTEVGMVLFYTDLLAKLWAFDYLNGTPNKDMENVTPITTTKVSPIYKQELSGLTHASLWFKPNDKSFQEIKKGFQLLFARSAARVYATFSNPVQPEEEVAPDAVSMAFLGWWNSRYEEIARYEPEYQRMNEIVKWGIIISWLNDAFEGRHLDFLHNLDVYKGNWFKDWVKSKPNLKFKKWDKVKFFKPGYLGTDTEVITILSPREYERSGLRWTIFGRVFVVPRSPLKLPPPITFPITYPIITLKSPYEWNPLKNYNFNYLYTKGLPLELLEKNDHLDYASTNMDGSIKYFYTLDGSRYKLANITPTSVSIIATPKRGAKLRDFSGEIRLGEIEQIFSSKTSGLEIETKIGGNRLGRLKISNSKSGFKIGWESRDIDTGQELARKLSKTENPTDVLFNEPNIESIIQQGEDQFFIKLKSSETWMKMVPEKTPGALIAYGYQSRVSDIEAGIKNYQLKWFEPPALESELRYGNNEYIIIRSFEDTGKEMIVVNPTRGPPPLSKSFEIDHGHFKIKGRIDPARGEIFIKRGSIPGNLRETPDKLQRVVKNDIPIILEIAKHPVDIIRLDRTNSLIDAVVTFLRNEDYGKIAKEIAQNPHQLKSILSDHLKDELLCIKEFQDAGQYSKAGHHLEVLTAIYGPLPQLKIRKGLILLKRGRYLEAKNQFHQELSESNKTDRERFLKEINSLIENSAMKFAFNKDKNKCYLEYFLDKNVKGSVVKETEIDNIIKNKPTLYIQDVPSLTNLDWSPATRTKNLTRAIRGRRVVKLLKSDIHKMKPEILHVPGEIKPSTLPPPPPSHYPYRFIPYPSYDDDDYYYEGERNEDICLIFAEK